MGNRAHVIFTDGTEIGPAIYLHWNGGPESVYAFLAELEERGFNRERGPDVPYATARFIAVVADFMGWEHNLSLGVQNGPKSITAKGLKNFDVGDNGIFVVSWKRDGGTTTPSFTVARFAANYKGLPRRLTVADVVAERKVALSSEYAPELKATFEKIREARLVARNGGA